MAARATMAWLITEVRGLIDDTDSTYFTDNQVQDVLDNTRLPLIYRELLEKDRERKVYTSARKGFEGVVDDVTGSWSGDTTIAIWNSVGAGATEFTPDAWNLRNGTFVFTVGQDRNLWLDAYEYDAYLSAAELLERLSVKRSITPGAGETGGAIRGRFELTVLADRYRRRAKPRRGTITRRYGSGSRYGRARVY